MNIANYISLRSFVYHLTATQNVGMIRQQRKLVSANKLADADGELQRLQTRRIESVQLSRALVRDQQPLHKGNISLSPGFTFEDLLVLLNSQVFFWPGTPDGPIPYGRRHFQRYESEKPTLLRIPTVDLVATNAPTELSVCKFNSGSPRCSGGRKSPRGPNTFTPISKFIGTPSQVVEVTFSDTATLPATTEVSALPTGPWLPLFEPGSRTNL